MTRERRWLDLETVRLAAEVARRIGVSEVATGPGGFVAAFTRASGRPDKLGTHRRSGTPWRQRRNAFVARHAAQVAEQGEALWEDGAPTRRHLALAVWAYSPDATRLRRWLRST